MRAMIFINNGHSFIGFLLSIQYVIKALYGDFIHLKDN